MRNNISEENVVLINQNMASLLNLRRLPARLDSRQAAARLGFRAHDIPILAKAGLLVPLGKPAGNAQKYYFADEVEAHARDRKWMDRAHRALANYWQQSKPRPAENLDGSEMV